LKLYSHKIFNLSFHRLVPDQYIIYRAYVRKSNLREGDDVIEIAEIVQRDIFQNTRYPLNRASFFKPAWTDCIDLASMLH